MTKMLLCDDPSMRWVDALTSIYGADYETDVSVSGDEKTDDGLFYRWKMETTGGMYFRRRRYPVDSDDNATEILYMRIEFGISRSCSIAYIIHEFMDIYGDNGVHFHTPLRYELVVKWTDGSYSRKQLDRLRSTSFLYPGAEQLL